MYHEQVRSDGALEKVIFEALQRCQPGKQLDVQLAQEGITVHF